MAKLCSLSLCKYGDFIYICKLILICYHYQNTDYDCKQKAIDDQFHDMKCCKQAIIKCDNPLFIGNKQKYAGTCLGNGQYKCKHGNQCCSNKCHTTFNGPMCKGSG